ncbi:MAG: hypothetical protein K2W85_16700 [Phycisphaerales bacterium]|nr:hypothetical protein [Phycisphaerales bacterium]
MRRSVLYLITTLATVATTTASNADIVNPSFEEFDANGQIIGWSSLGYGLWDNWNGFGGTPNSGAGQTAVSMEGPAGGWQTVALSAGDVILFDAAPAQPFGPGYGGGRFNLQVWLCPPTNVYPSELGNPWDLSTPTQANISWSEPAAPYGLWTTHSLIAPATGLYTLGFFGWAYSNVPFFDTRWVMIDNFRTVPSPGAAVLLGLVGAVAARRRR